MAHIIRRLFKSAPVAPVVVAPVVTFGPWAEHGGRCTCNVCR